MSQSLPYGQGPLSFLEAGRSQWLATHESHRFPCSPCHRLAYPVRPPAWHAESALRFVKQNQPQSVILFRLLAIAHGIVGLLPLAFSVLVGGLLSGGSWWMPARGFSLEWLLVVTIQLFLPVTWAAWLLVLAFRLWCPSARLVLPLRCTHLVVLLFGGLHCAWGFIAVRAAERSAAAGGGLLSPAAFIPLLVGVPLVALALLSLFAASRIPPLR